MRVCGFDIGEKELRNLDWMDDQQGQDAIAPSTYVMHTTQLCAAGIPEARVWGEDKEFGRP